MGISNFARGKALFCIDQEMKEKECNISGDQQAYVALVLLYVYASDYVLNYIYEPAKPPHMPLPRFNMMK